MTRREILALAPAAAAVSAGASAPEATKPLLRSAICAYSYREQLAKKQMTYEDVVRMCVETGADGLDCTVYWMPADPPDDFLFSLKRFAYRHGVSIYSIAIRTDMCRPAGDLRDKELAAVRKWVDIAQKLGAVHIRVFGGNVPKGATEDQAAEWASETLRQAVDYSSRKGIILGLENHGGITDKAERIVQIVKAANSPWAGINLDTGNFRSDTWRQIELCIPYAVNVQVKMDQVQEDGKRGPGDWERVVKMLVKGGYRGFLALEYEGKNALEEVPAYMRKLTALVRKYSA